MARPCPKLQWCIIEIGDDSNWWISDISDETNWDVDGLGIIDPRQISHIIDLCDPLREYGFDPETIDQAFFSFVIDREIKEGRVRLVRSRESLIDGDEQAFALPDILDEEKGPYADFLDQITRARVKMLNDLIHFDKNLTIEELEEDIRERQNADYFEGRAVHFFTEITAILEYVPEGYELDEEEEEDGESDEDEEIADIPDLEESEDESLVEDDTMRWDDSEDEEEIPGGESLDDLDDDEESPDDEPYEEETADDADRPSRSRGRSGRK